MGVILRATWKGFNGLRAGLSLDCCSTSFCPLDDVFGLAVNSISLSLHAFLIPTGFVVGVGALFYQCCKASKVISVNPEYAFNFSFWKSLFTRHADDVFLCHKNHLLM